MKREYNSGTVENVQFFIGTEVEHTPAHNKKTLFVVGVHEFDQIEKILEDPFTKIEKPVEHIYFGANQSFPKTPISSEIWSTWETMIIACLKKGFLSTLDFDVSHVEIIAKSTLCEYNNFIPQISVKLPYLQQLGYNATIKIDDKDFNSTNFGIWCHSLHNLTTRENFTSWYEYTKDQILK